MSGDEAWWREELGRALAILRTACGLKQDDLAQVAGIRESSISDYERGKIVPGLKTLQKLLGGQGLSLVAIQEAQGLLRIVRQERLGALQQPGGADGAEKGNVPSTMGLDRLALRREIDRVAGDTGKNVAQLIRLTLLALCDQPTAAAIVPTAEGLTDRHEGESEGRGGEGPC